MAAARLSGSRPLGDCPIDELGVHYLARIHIGNCRPQASRVAC